jgi:hypothetical protein
LDGKAPYERQAESLEVVLLDDLVQVAGEQLKTDTEVVAEVKVFLRRGRRLAVLSFIDLF